MFGVSGSELEFYYKICECVLHRYNECFGSEHLEFCV